MVSGKLGYAVSKIFETKLCMFYGSSSILVPICLNVRAYLIKAGHPYDLNKNWHMSIKFGQLAEEPPPQTPSIFKILKDKNATKNQKEHCVRVTHAKSLK